MSVPTTIDGTVLNGQTWFVSSTGTYANKLVWQSTSGPKHYYLGSNLHNDGTDRSANEIYFDTSDNKWHDSGSSNPVSFRSGSVGSELPAESALPTSETNTGFASEVVSVNDNVIIYRGSSLEAIFSFTQPSFSASGGGTGGTSTEGVPTPVGSVGRVGQMIHITIDKNSPSSSLTVTYDIQKNGVSQGPGITHTNNTTTDFVQNIDFAPGIWRLWYQESGGGDELLDIFNASEARKRHANFW